MTISGITNDSSLVIDSDCTMLDISGFKCGAIDVSASNRLSISNGFLTSKNALSARIIYLHGNANFVKLSNIQVNSSNFLTLYLQDAHSITVDGISDEAGGTYSVGHGSNVSNVRYDANYFNKLTPFNTMDIVPINEYGIPKGVIVPIFTLGRNSYSNKGNITGDGTAYKCAFDGDGLNFSNKNNVSDLTKFRVPLEAVGKYLFIGTIGLENVGSSHTIAELYLRKNDTQNYYLDYHTLSTSTTIKVLLKGSVILMLEAGDIIELVVKVSGGTKTVVWSYEEFGGQVAGTLLFAQ